MKPKAGNSKPLAKRSREQNAIIKKVIKLEKLVWKVAQERDANAFQELVPADAIMIFQSGIMRQPDYLKTMKERTIAHYEFGPIRGFMPTDSIVILVYQAVRIGHEGIRSFPQGAVLESTTWVKRKGRWVAVLNQETPDWRFSGKKKVNLVTKPPVEGLKHAKLPLPDAGTAKEMEK